MSEAARTYSDATMRRIESALEPVAMQTPKELIRRFDDLAPATIRGGLSRLVREGRATFTGPMGSRRYRRVG